MKTKRILEAVETLPYQPDLFNRLSPAELRQIGAELWAAWDFIHPTLIRHAATVDLERFRTTLHRAIGALREQPASPPLRGG